MELYQNPVYRAYGYDECDSTCGGKDSDNKLVVKGCKNPEHIAYQIQLWVDRYGKKEMSAFLELDQKTNGDYDNQYAALCIIKLDEIKIGTKIGEHYDNHNSDTWKDVSMDYSEEYAQLYVPYQNFERACKQIMSYYVESENCAGYHNYMKYWARNGDVDWICNTEEYDGPIDGKTKVKYIYTDANFWDKYDGSKHPTGDPVMDSRGRYTKANGWQ